MKKSFCLFSSNSIPQHLSTAALIPTTKESINHLNHIRPAIAANSYHQCNSSYFRLISSWHPQVARAIHDLFLFSFILVKKKESTRRSSFHCGYSTKCIDTFSSKHQYICRFPQKKQMRGREEGRQGKARGQKKGTSGLEHVCMDQNTRRRVSVQLSIWISGHGAAK